MDLIKNIEEKYKASIKSKKTEEINTLRLIRNAIKNKDIELRSSEKKETLDNNKIISILQNLIKQRRDSIDSFKKASRDDLVKKEEKEIEIIKSFLPEQLDSEQIKKIIEKFIDEKNISSIKDMGQVMAFIKKDYAGSIDMGLAGKIAKEILNT